jgi:metal-dependent amidase/aminoacylase/carboxypeptidase family protein
VPRNGAAWIPRPAPLGRRAWRDAVAEQEPDRHAAQIVTRADRAGAPNHSPLFMVDEKYLKTGVRAFVNVALEYMQGR